VTSPVITARAGREPDPGPFRGVPHWLRLQLSRWLSDLLRPDTKYEDTVTLHRVIARLRIPAANWSNSISAWSSIEGWLYEDTEGERLLDVIHVVIQATPGMTGYRLLDQILSDGGSAYAATERGIEDRVDATPSEPSRRPPDRGTRPAQSCQKRGAGRTPGSPIHPTPGITASRQSKQPYGRSCARTTRQQPCPMSLGSCVTNHGSSMFEGAKAITASPH
jgi:hypothetical protein